MSTYFSSEFVGRDRPRQLALNGSTTEYHLKNVAHDTEYVLTLYVLFGSVVGPGVSATFKTREQQCRLIFRAQKASSIVEQLIKNLDSFEVGGLSFTFALVVIRCAVMCCTTCNK